MKKYIMVMSLTLLLLTGMVSSIDAYPVKVGFLFDGLDLDTGTVQYDRMILVILMGATIEEILRPTTDFLADFSPSVDLSFDFDPAEVGVIDLLLLEGVKVAVLEDTAIGMVDDDMLKSLKFRGNLSSIPITSDDLVVIRTTEHRFFLLSEFHWSGWTVKFEVDDVTSRIIPEPSTLVLLGLGLLLTIRVLKRKTHLRLLLLFILLLLSIGWAENVHARPNQRRITIKKEGAGTGTILIGDQECGPDCIEMNMPYMHRRALVLKVIPDEDSYFVRWKKADGSSSKGAVHIRRGESVIAVFEKKWVSFDSTNPVETPTPPAIHVPVSNLQEVIVDVTFPGMHVGIIEAEGEAYQQLTIPDTGHVQTVGAPQLPMLGRFIALPAGANVSVEVLESAVQELEEYMIYPAQEPLPDMQGISPPPFTKAEAVYQQDAFYPSKLVELEGPFIIRGASVVILRMFPVQFNPVQRKVRVYSHLRVKVAFENGEEYFIDDRNRSSSFDSILGNLLLNADTVLVADAAADAAADDGNSLLIITHPDFLDAAKTLAE